MPNKEYERLEKVANRYFGSLANLSTMMGRAKQFLYSYKDRPGIGRKILLELKEKFNINIKYIQYGEEPMLLTESKAENSSKVKSNVETVAYVDILRLPDIRHLSLEQMKKIVEWAEENIPKMKELLKVYEKIEK